MNRIEFRFGLVFFFEFINMFMCAGKIFMRNTIQMYVQCTCISYSVCSFPKVSLKNVCLSRAYTICLNAGAFSYVRNFYVRHTVVSTKCHSKRVDCKADDCVLWACVRVPHGAFVLSMVHSSIVFGKYNPADIA